MLVRTSNPGAADVEDLELVESARGASAGRGSVWERLADLVDELGRPGVGESGLSDVGAVVGATSPGHLARARELMPRAVFLLPGVGAQGGRVEDLAAGLRARTGRRPGNRLAQHRGRISTVDRWRSGSGDSPAAAARAEAERLRDLAWALHA